MSERTYPEAPKAIRVVAILGAVASVISLFGIVWLSSEYGSLGAIGAFVTIMLMVNIVLMLYMYRNSVKAAYLYLILMIPNLIINLANKDFLRILVSIVIAIIVFSHIDGMKRAQAWFDSEHEYDASVTQPVQVLSVDEITESEKKLEPETETGADPAG